MWEPSPGSPDSRRRTCGPWAITTISPGRGIGRSRSTGTDGLGILQASMYPSEPRAWICQPDGRRLDTRGMMPPAERLGLLDHLTRSGGLLLGTRGVVGNPVWSRLRLIVAGMSFLAVLSLGATAKASPLFKEFP